MECLVQRAETLLRLGDQANALREAERAMARAEALGLKVPLAKAHYLKASVLRAKGDPAARREYAAALRLLEEVKRDERERERAQARRSAAMHAECVKWSTATGT